MDISLSKALGIPRGVTTFYGPGDKSKLIEIIADELTPKYKVLHATADEMKKPKEKTLFSPVPAEVLRAFMKEDFIAVGIGAEEGKVGALKNDMPLFPVLADAVLIEKNKAGFYREKPAGEYNLIDSSNLLVAVYDIDTGLNAKEIALSVSSLKDEIKKNFTVILNGAHTKEQRECAFALAKELSQIVLITDLDAKEKVIDLVKP